MIAFPDIPGFFAGLKPIPRITVSEWADEYRYLAPESSAEPGRYRTDRTPYLRKIMDCLSVHEPYKEVFFEKGAQIGGTEAGTNFLGYIMHYAPAPVMFVQPTDELVKRTSKGRVDPLISACPELKEKVADVKSRDSKNTITQKSFDGGVLIMAGANSPAGLRSMPARYLILDEVDAYPLDLGGEGSPAKLAAARTRTFPNKKGFMVSTPTIEGISVIDAAFKKTDQNYYHVPCPHCGEYQKLVFEQLKWPEGKPEAVQYYCIHCGSEISERHKPTMLARGRWVPDNPDKSNPDKIGFHLNSLYSPLGWYSWREIAADWVDAQGDQNKLKTFINTTLAETWAERGEAPPYKNLHNRCEGYAINTAHEEVCFITAGVDVQKDRLEIEIVGWCADKRSYSIDYRVLDGDTGKADVWNKLADIVGETWSRADGVELGLKLMAVDSGYNTDHVYTFCRRFDVSRVIPVKGHDSLGMAVGKPTKIDYKPNGKRAGKISIWHVGVSYLKSSVYAALRLEKDSEGNPPPLYCHFPQYSENYFRGLTAEELVKHTVKGYPRYYWIKRYERNEPLDCRVYARAAATVVGLDRLKPEQIAAMGGISRTPSAPKTTSGQRKRRDGSIWDC